MPTLPDLGMNLEHTVYLRKWQFEVGKMTEMMGMDFQQHQSPEILVPQVKYLSAVYRPRFLLPKFDGTTRTGNCHHHRV